jgi:hypothetical protein
MARMNLSEERKTRYRYEDFRRLDVRLMHFRQMYGRYFTVFSLEAINILDISTF